MKNGRMKHEHMKHGRMKHGHMILLASGTDILRPKRNLTAYDHRDKKPPHQSLSSKNIITPYWSQSPKNLMKKELLRKTTKKKGQWLLSF